MVLSFFSEVESDALAQLLGLEGAGEYLEEGAWLVGSADEVIFSRFSELEGEL